MPMKIIDTSHWKGDINLAAVDIDGVYTKATEGTYYVDDACDNIVQQAISLGKKWGVYHFATNRITDAISEANYFVNNCQGYVTHGILILDNENYHWSDGTLANDPLDVASAKQPLDQEFTLTAVQPALYMSLNIRQSANSSRLIDARHTLRCA